MPLDKVWSIINDIKRLESILIPNPLLDDWIRIDIVNISILY